MSLSSLAIENLCSFLVLDEVLKDLSLGSVMEPSNKTKSPSFISIDESFTFEVVLNLSYEVSSTFGFMYL